MSKPKKYSSKEIAEVQVLLEEPIAKISIQSNVVFRILQHHHHSNVSGSSDKEYLEKKMKSVRGQLLGMPNSGVLEVTNSFALPPKQDQSAESYPSQMASLLAKTEDSDTHNVGWYQSTSLNSFMNSNTIWTHYQYQRDFKDRCICLVYDPVRTKKQGSLWLKAFRLSAQFMKLVAASAPKVTDPIKQLELEIFNGGLPDDFPKISIDTIQKLQMKNSEIFEEIPIQIENSGLLEVLTHDLNKMSQHQYSSLNLSNMDYLEKNLHQVLDNYDDMFQEQSQLWKKMRDKSDSTPNRLDNMLISTQIETYSKEILQENTKNLALGYVAKSLVLEK